MSEPTTKAGRALLDSVPFLRWDIDGIVTPASIELMAQRVLAIETEARSDATALRTAAEAAFVAINAMHGDLGPDNDAPWHKHEDVWRALGKALK